MGAIPKWVKELRSESRLTRSGVTQVGDSSGSSDEGRGENKVKKQYDLRKWCGGEINDIDVPLFKRNDAYFGDCRLSYAADFVSRTQPGDQMDSANDLRPRLQNYSNVPGLKLKWHEDVVHKTVFRDCVKHHHLRPALGRKRRHSVVQNPIILHDNARSHTAAAVKDLLRCWQWEILEHPPYSPDMSPCDYDLFAKVKEPLSSRADFSPEAQRFCPGIENMRSDDGRIFVVEVMTLVVSASAAEVVASAVDVELN
ncbi:hypothetical protein ANN_00603 [Periplaneta americana]|uniref:Mariner Mos1 transposase n=1 Tax=Periplaneta americana TaxID=6978 RepID=A0ABQ8TTM6_PERAM|nr:hypothetical protein ANN_00603 [Periplaneta americana]